MTFQKKILIPLIAIAGLLPLAGCYSPYYDRASRAGYYDSYGNYHNDRYSPYRNGYDRYGYRDDRDDRDNRDTTRSDRDTGRAETTRPGDPYYDNYTPRY